MRNFITFFSLENCNICKKVNKGFDMWSDELQKQTKEHFEKLPMARMKHFGDSKFGTGILKDGKYIVIEDDMAQKYEFNSIEEIIENAWAID